MNEAERKALLDLWRDVPGCGIGAEWAGDSWRRGGITPPASDISALARDAMVEWLHSGSGQVQTCKTWDNECDRYVWQCWADGIGVGGPHYPTRLLALIAAVRAVAGEGEK